MSKWPLMPHIYNLQSIISTPKKVLVPLRLSKAVLGLDCESAILCIAEATEEPYLVSYYLVTRIRSYILLSACEETCMKLLRPR